MNPVEIAGAGLAFAFGKYELARNARLEAEHNGLLAQLEALSRYERQGGLANMMARAPLVVLTREERWEAGEKPVMPWEIE